MILIKNGEGTENQGLGPKIFEILQLYTFT